MRASSRRSLSDGLPEEQHRGCGQYAAAEETAAPSGPYRRGQHAHGTHVVSVQHVVCDGTITALAGDGW